MHSLWRGGLAVPRDYGFCDGLLVTKALPGGDAWVLQGYASGLHEAMRVPSSSVSL